MSRTRPARWKLAAAFSAIYFVWGSTYLAIRVGVLEIPPFTLAALRMTAAGLILGAAMLWRGRKPPTARQWLSCAALGFILFTVDYACLFWASRRVPSGMTAIMMATIPALITLLDALVLGGRLAAPIIVGLAAGSLGVVVLVSSRLALGQAPIDPAGAAVLLLGAAAWSAGTIASRRLPLPASRGIAAAAQMLCGGTLLCVLAAAAGEPGLRALAGASLKAWAALGYLTVAGSIIGFTAYVWLLDVEPPSVVGTYAYVNPLVAVALGWAVGGEPVGPRTLLGAGLILAAVAAMRGGARPRPPVDPGQ